MALIVPVRVIGGISALFILFLVQMPQTESTPVAAINTPEITFWHPDSYSPDSHTGCYITWQYNDSTVFSGTIVTHLFWSRNKIEYVSILPDAVASYTYRAYVPAQDGSDDQRYQDGAGRLYWYVRLYISGYADEAEYLFTPENPNDEIYFLDQSNGETEIPQSSEAATKDNAPLFNVESLPNLGESLEDFFNNPLLVGMVFVTSVITLVMLLQRNSPSPKKPRKSTKKRGKRK